MHLSTVESSAILATGYDESRKVLRVQFQSRAVYDYFGVPAGVHPSLLSAASKGGYFNQAIRGRFPFACASERSSNGVATSSAEEARWRAQ